jgi:hypothetical protein
VEWIVSRLKVFILLSQISQLAHSVGTAAIMSLAYNRMPEHRGCLKISLNYWGFTLWSAKILLMMLWVGIVSLHYLLVPDRQESLRDFIQLLMGTAPFLRTQDTLSVMMWVVFTQWQVLTRCQALSKQHKALLYEAGYTVGRDEW